MLVGNVGSVSHDFCCLFAFHSLHKLLAKELGTGDATYLGWCWRTFWPTADANSKCFSLFCKRKDQTFFFRETKKSKPVCIFYEHLVITELTNIACRSVNAVFYLPISVHNTNKMCISYSMRTLQGTDVCICAPLVWCCVSEADSHEKLMRGRLRCVWGGWRGALSYTTYFSLGLSASVPCSFGSVCSAWRVINYFFCHYGGDFLLFQHVRPNTSENSHGEHTQRRPKTPSIN